MSLHQQGCAQHLLGYRAAVLQQSLPRRCCLVQTFEPFPLPPRGNRMLLEREPKFPGFVPWLDDTKHKFNSLSRWWGKSELEEAPGEAISSQKGQKVLK